MRPAWPPTSTSPPSPTPRCLLGAAIEVTSPASRPTAFPAVPLIDNFVIGICREGHQLQAPVFVRGQLDTPQVPHPRPPFTSATAAAGQAKCPAPPSTGKARRPRRR